MSSLHKESCSSTQESVVEFPTQSTPQHSRFQFPIAKERTSKKLDRTEYYIIRGYITICSISALVALFSILLIHAMSSIWLDPVRNRKLTKDFVYITVALAASSISLNFYALATFGIQIFLVYSDYRQDEQRMVLYLKKVATFRFVAAFAVFFSIPLFMTSFGCYLYMEFRHPAAFIAVSILGVAFLGMIFSVAVSYCKWNQTFNKMIRDKNLAKSKQAETTREELSFTIHNPSFVLEENLFHPKNISLKKCESCKQKNSEFSSEILLKGKDQAVKPKPRKISAITNKKRNGDQIKEKIIQTVTKQRNPSKTEDNLSFNLEDINCSASTLV